MAARWPPAQRASLKPYSWQKCNHSPSLKSPQIKSVQTTPPPKPRPAARGFSWPPGGRPPKGLRLSLTRGRNAITLPSLKSPQITVQTMPPSKTTPRRQGLLVAARWPPAQRASLKPYSWQECNHSPSLKSPQITVQTMPPSKTTPRRQGLLVAARWPPAQRASLKPYSWQECNHSPSLKSPQITVQTAQSAPHRRTGPYPLTPAVPPLTPAVRHPLASFS